MTTSTTSFNFDAINNATRGMTAGMKLAIAQGLLTQACNTLEKFENPLAEEAHTLGNELASFRVKYKESSIAAQEAKKQETNS